MSARSSAVAEERIASRPPPPTAIADRVDLVLEPDRQGDPEEGIVDIAGGHWSPGTQVLEDFAHRRRGHELAGEARPYRTRGGHRQTPHDEPVQRGTLASEVSRVVDVPVEHDCPSHRVIGGQGCHLGGSVFCCSAAKVVSPSR